MTNVIVLSNIAALRAYSGGSASPSIWVEGYASAGDGGEGMFTYVPTDSSSADNGGTIILDALSDRYYREQHLGPFNILWFGGSGNGSTDNATALNHALSALHGGGGEVFFPPGKYVFNSTINYSLPTGTFSVSISGSGADSTILYWPSSNAIAFNASNSAHSIHLRDFSVTTGAAGSYTGIVLNNSVLLGNFAQSDVTRVTFRGDYSGSNNYYWSFALAINGLSNVSYDTLLFYGYSGNGGGVGLSGVSSTSPYYSIVHNFSKCGFFGLGIGLDYGNYVQGVTVSQTNFTNGITGIFIPSGITTPAQLAVIGCQFNCTATQINVQSPSTGLFINSNVFYVPSNNYGILFASSGNQALIQGNTFSGASLTGSTGIAVSGSFTESVAIGNVFNNLNVGVNLTAASGWNVQANVYQTVTTKTINGSGNSVGVATS